MLLKLPQFVPARVVFSLGVSVSTLAVTYDGRFETSGLGEFEAAKFLPGMISPSRPREGTIGCSNDHFTVALMRVNGTIRPKLGVAWFAGISIKRFRDCPRLYVHGENMVKSKQVQVNASKCVSCFALVCCLRSAERRGRNNRVGLTIRATSKKRSTSRG